LSSDVRLSGTSLTVGDRTFEVWTKDRTVDKKTDGTDRFTLSPYVESKSIKLTSYDGSENGRDSPFIPQYGTSTGRADGVKTIAGTTTAIANFWKFGDPNLFDKLKTGPFGNNPTQIYLIMEGIKINIQPMKTSISEDATCSIKIAASKNGCKMTELMVNYHNTDASPEGCSFTFKNGEDDEIVLKDSSSNTIAYIIPPTADQMNAITVKKTVYYAGKGYAI